MLTHTDIMEKKFSVTRIKEGYAQDEVDDFLEVLASNYKMMEAMLADLQHEKDKWDASRSNVTSPLQHEGTSQYDERVGRGGRNRVNEDDGLSLDAIKTVLESAQKAAQQITEQAILEAEKIKSQAMADCGSVVEDAKAEAATILANAEVEQKTRVIELERRHTELTLSLVELEERRTKLREWARVTLESLLKETSIEDTSMPDGLKKDTKIRLHQP
ncbi:DivIVA domain-containing protein [Streptomyces sp. 1222.5]|uniref:DivIVA domain-containing protein n=1 Tax=Streptomyces sp. 1222.5 TaxID=1881026 RepID=UPI003D73467A